MIFSSMSEDINSVILLSVICLCISSVDCLVNCTEVVVDGQYTNLSVYTEPVLTSKMMFTSLHWMFNRKERKSSDRFWANLGIQVTGKWSFDISFDDNKNGSDGSDGVVDHFGDVVEYHFSKRKELIYYSNNELGWYDFARIYVGCYIKPEVTDISCHMNLWEYGPVHSGGQLNQDIKQHMNFSHSSVFLRPKPSMFGERLAPTVTQWYVLAIDKDNRNKRIKLIFPRWLWLTQEMCDNSVNCPHIPFIDGPTPTMSDQLFRQIDSLVEYRNGSIYGHLLFFTINNKPFYCLQPENHSHCLNRYDIHCLKPLILQIDPYFSVRPKRI